PGTNPAADHPRPGLDSGQGLGALEVGQAYTRARELCRQVGETPQLFSVLQGLLAFYNLQGDLQRARELGEHLLRLAHRSRDPALPSVAHHVLGRTLYWLGEFPLARAYFEQSLVLSDPRQPHSPASLSRPESRTLCLGYTAGVLWLLGYPDQSLQRNHQALSRAQELAQPLSLAMVLSQAASHHMWRGEIQASRENAEAVIALCEEHGFPHHLAEGITMRGYALAAQGQVEEGVVQIRQGLAALQATGDTLQRPGRLVLLASAYARAGQVEAGLTALTEALAILHQRGQQPGPELYRLKGELTLQQFNVQSSRFK